MDVIRKNQIKNFIIAGKLENNKKHQYCKALKSASDIAKNLIGCTFIVKGKPFILSMVELYYGSAGDNYHDWFRNHYIHKCSKYRIRSEVQAKEGLRTYIAYQNVNYKYNRMDLVIGPENVAISILIRNVINSNGDLVGKTSGSPNKILRQMGITNEDHDKKVHIIANLDNISCNEIYLFNTRNDFIKKNKSCITETPRINLKKNKQIFDFEDKNSLRWNYKVEGTLFKVKSILSNFKNV